MLNETQSARVRTLWEELNLILIELINFVDALVESAGLISMWIETSK